MNISALPKSPFSPATPFSPPSGPATGSFNVLHAKSKFLAAVGTFSGLTLSFNKRQPPATDISYVIETSPNLLPPWTARVTHIAPGNTDATISHTLPAGQGKIFARLRITHP